MTDAEYKEVCQRLDWIIHKLSEQSEHDWYCGCGHWNGPNLAFCAICRRDPRGKHEGEI